MANKSSDRLDRLPSVSQLLENPQVRVLAERVTRSAMVTGVRSFLDELRADLRDRPLPSLSNLAELAAQYVVGRQQSHSAPIINATGRIVSQQWLSVPLADSAQQAVVGIAQQFVTTAQAADETTNAPLDQAVESLCQLTGADLAAVVHSYEGALWLVSTALASPGEVLIARGDLLEFPSGCSLPELVRGTGSRIVEVGHANGVRLSDFERAAGERTAVVLRARSDNFRVVGNVPNMVADELINFAHRRQLTYVEALDAAPLNGDLASAADWFTPPPSIDAAARLAAGADLVVLRGDGFLGGPPCGVVLGREALVRQLTTHHSFGAWKLDPHRAEMLVETLRSSGRTARSPAAPTTPVARLLATSTENLRHRAERLTEQLTESPSLAVCEPTPLVSHLTDSGAPEFAMRSYGVALTPIDGDVDRLQQDLRAATRPIVGRVEKDRLLLDLRTVLPEQDAPLVTTILELGSPPPAFPDAIPLGDVVT